MLFLCSFHEATKVTDVNVVKIHKVVPFLAVLAPFLMSFLCLQVSQRTTAKQTFPYIWVFQEQLKIERPLRLLHNQAGFRCIRYCIEKCQMSVVLFYNQPEVLWHSIIHVPCDQIDVVIQSFFQTQILANFRPDHIEFFVQSY